MSDDETSDSRADLLRRELVLLRDRSGISTSKVRERAPNLMHLPCVDAELERRGWRDADRAHAAVVVLRCTVENGALDETPKALLRITLNFAVVPDNLDERRRVVQEQLNQLDFQKAYFSYEEKVYRSLAAELVTQTRAPCNDPEESHWESESQRLAARSLITYMIASVWHGDDARAYEGLRELIEQYAPQAAHKFFVPGGLAVVGVKALLHTVAYSRYAKFASLRTSRMLSLLPYHLVEYLPHLNVVLNTQVDAPLPIALPVALRHTDTLFGRESFINEFGETGEEREQFVRVTTEVLVRMIGQIEEQQQWDLVITEAKHKLRYGNNDDPAWMDFPEPADEAASARDPDSFRD